MEEKKEKTIQKAREYFHKYWYRKASLSDLIAETGISKPTFYNYFKNKEELFNAVMLATYNEFQYEYGRRVKSAANAMEKLDILVHTYGWFLDTYPLFADLHKPGNDLMPRWLKSRNSKDLFAEGLAIMRSILEQGREEGLFNPRLDLEKASLILYSILTLLPASNLGACQERDKPAAGVDLETLLSLLGEGLLQRNA